MHASVSSLAFSHHPLLCVIYKYRHEDPSVWPVRKERKFCCKFVFQSCVRENLQDIKKYETTLLYFLLSCLTLPVFFFAFTLTRVPDRAAWVRHRVLQLGGVRGGAAPPPGGRGRLRDDVLPSAGGPEREHEPGLPASSQRVRPLHRVHEGERLSVLCCVSDVKCDTPGKKKRKGNSSAGNEKEVNHLLLAGFLALKEPAHTHTLILV